MSGSADKVAYFRMVLESDLANTFRGDAAAAEDLRASMQTSAERIKSYQATIRSLRGSSEEVVAAKEALLAKLDQEKNKFSASNVELLKQGANYEALTLKVKKAEQEKAKADKRAEAEAIKAQTAAIKAQTQALDGIGGPLADVARKFGSVKAIVEDSGGRMGLLKVATIAATAAAVAFAAAALSVAAALSKWILQSASAERSLQLVRKAMAGTEENASNLGSQVDLLASKVDLPKEKINALGVELMKTRLSGQSIVDTMNAVAQTSSAMGDATGKAIEDIITRGQRWNGFQLNPLELQGTGLKFDSVAAELARGMGTSVQAAQAALWQGRVRLEDGAKAIRMAVEKQFGDINAEKLTTLDGITETWHKHVASLTKDVDWRPFGRGIGEIMKQFDASTVTGASFKVVIDDIGKTLTEVFQGSVPTVKRWITEFSTTLLRLDTQVIKIRTAMRGGFADDATKEKILLLKGAFEGLKIAGYAAAAGLAALAVSAASAVAPFLAVGAAIYGLTKWADWSSSLGTKFGENARQWGIAMIDGLLSGIKEGYARLKGAVMGAVSVIKSTFTGKDGIDAHSPSKWFDKQAGNSIDGYAGGLDRRGGEVQEAVAAMAPSSVPAVAPSSGGGGGITIHIGGIAVTVGGGGSGKDVAAALTSPSFLEEITHMFEHAAQAAGIRSQAAVVP